MTARSRSIPTAFAHASPPNAGVSWRNVATAGLFIGLGWAGPQLGTRVTGADPLPPVQAAARQTQAVAFVAQATGTLTGGSNLYDAPAGGAVQAQLPAGTTVTVGGLVHVPAGLWTRDVLWVRVGVDAVDAGAAPARYGFVPATTVAVTAGTPLVLEVGNVPREALLAPGSAVSYAGGEPVEAAALGAAPAAAPGTGPAAVPEAAPAGDAGLFSTGIGTADDFAIAWLPQTVVRWKPEILAAAKAHGVDPALVAIVMLVESGGGPQAVSPSGATGLMQVMPGTGADIARQRGIAAYQLAEPATNVDFGAWYLARQLQAFGRADGDPDWQQSVELAASAYNGGPGSVQRLQAGGSLPNETARYRQWVGGMWRERSDASSPTFDAWMQAGGARLVAAAEGAATDR